MFFALSASLMQLWRNMPCSASASAAAPPCVAEAASAGRRGFHPLAADNVQLSAIDNAYAGAFLDLNNNGWLDVFVLRTPTPVTAATEGGVTATAYANSAVALANNFNEDAYFLTLMGINGACPSWCPTGTKFPDPRPYGAAAVGASFKFTITSLSGTKSVRQSTQLPQSAYLPLGMPYTHSGLGRTASYIEEVFAAFPIHSSQHYNMWVAMVPNAQLIVFPYPAETHSAWTLELFVSPSTRLFWVGVAFVATLLLLAGTVYFFHRREKAEDNKERRAQINSYFFSGR